MDRSGSHNQQMLYNMIHVMPKIIILHVTMCLALFSLSCTRSQPPETYTTLGEDPLMNITVMEDGSEALVTWAEKGIEDAILVHIATRDAMAAVTPENMETMRQVIKQKNWKTLKERNKELYDNSNYLNAAAQLEIVNKIYWVIPYRFFEDIPLAKEKILNFLKSSQSGFKEDELQRMRMTEGCLTGLLAGADIHICSPRTLPKIHVPVLVSMHVSYFPEYAQEAGISKLRALKWVMDYLAFKQKLRVSHVAVTYGIAGGNADAVHRYIGDQLIEVLGNPQILKAESPPELWQFRDRAENMLSGGEDKRVLEYLEEPMKTYPDDLPLRLMNAAALVRLKKFSEAFSETDEICTQDKNYCYGFIYLGNVIEDKKWQKQFYDKAQESLPDSDYVKNIVTSPPDLK
jgi:hypothetical protein